MYVEYLLKGFSTRHKISILNRATLRTESLYLIVSWSPILVFSFFSPLKVSIAVIAFPVLLMPCYVSANEKAKFNGSVVQKNTGRGRNFCLQRFLTGLAGLMFSNSTQKSKFQTGHLFLLASAYGQNNYFFQGAKITSSDKLHFYIALMCFT